jgi:hypothetical protein
LHFFLLVPLLECRAAAIAVCFGGQMFKKPLEDLSESDGQLLNNTELKIIFGNLPPIYEVHKQMLEELCWTSSHWKEDLSIGQVFLKYVSNCVWQVCTDFML